MPLSRDQIDQTIKLGQRVDVKLTTPVNAYWYIYRLATPDGGCSSAQTSISATACSRCRAALRPTTAPPEEEAN